MPEKLYTVKEGDWLSSIARKFGVGDWKKIYDHPKNKEFKEKYPDPNILNPGEELWIPEPEYLEIEPKRLNSSVKKIEVSNLKKETIEIVFKGEDGRPLADEPYKLKIGGYEKDGVTDGDGKMKEEIEASLTEFDSYRLEMAGRVYEVGLGYLDPAAGATGIQERLSNLGYDVGSIDGTIGPRTQAATRAFQKDYDLTADGVLTPETKQKIEEVFERRG